MYWQASKFGEYDSQPQVAYFYIHHICLFDYVIELSYILFFVFLLYSYFEAMFRSFMPEDNTVTVSKTPFIGDKTELLFYELRVSLKRENDFSLNSVLRIIPKQQT